MPNFNKVVLMGNLTRDPELRVTPKGTSVCQFGMAVNRIFNTEGGERQEETTFVDLEAWGRQAEVISKYVTKGNPLFVEGRLKFDSWESKTGEKRSKLKVVVENMQLMGGRSGDSQGAPPERSGSSSSGAAPEAQAPQKRSQAPSSDDIEEDVPF